MVRHPYRILAQKIKKGVLQLFVLVAATTAIPAYSEDGTLGWSYFISLYNEGYVSDPAKACQLTAQNHMGTALEDMRPMAGEEMAYDCKYKHFLPADGQAHWYGSTTFYCKPGYTRRQPGVCVKRPERSPPPPPPTGGPGGCFGDPGTCVGNPVIVSSGAKVQHEVDFTGNGAWPLRIERTYRTLRETWWGQSAGVGWSFSFDRALVLAEFSSGRPQVVSCFTGDGSFLRFVWNGKSGRYEPTFDKSARLESLSANNDDWVLTHADGRIDRFRPVLRTDGVAGPIKLVSSHTPDGQAAYYTYDGIFDLRTITDGQGRKLDITWVERDWKHLDHLVEMISGPEGNVRYEYDYSYQSIVPFHLATRLHRRIHVTQSGSEFGQHTYHYEDKSNPFLMTGITDEKGARFSTYAYNEQGQVILSEHAGGVDRHTFAYPDENTRIVSDALGTPRTYKVQDYGRGGVITALSQPDSAPATDATATFTYENGYLRSQTDFNGNRTCFEREPNRRLETGRVSGLTSADSCYGIDPSMPLPTPGARRISTRWHPDFPIATGVAEPNRIITYVYNGQRDVEGRLIECAQQATLPNGKPIAVPCRKSIQPTTDMNGETGFAAIPSGPARVWNYTYTSLGKLLTSTGPTNSAGSAESESRAYYEDSTATHQAGDLATVTNPAGEVTMYLEYSPSGLPTKIKSARNQTVSLDYDSRQNPVAIRVEDSNGLLETRTFDYNPIGQIVQSTAPDGTFVQYNYDQAHRLTQLADSIGNTLQLDLDGMGNVTRETTFGPTGQLDQQLTRSFDPLNRLERTLGGVDQTGVRFKYDKNGYLTTSIDQLGRVTTQQYDRFGRVVRTLLPPPTPTSDRHVIDFSYDQLNHLTSVTDLRRLVTRYNVDSFGQRRGVISPDTGTTTGEFDGTGNLLSKKDARGATVSYQYDAAQRLVKFNSSSYEYGPGGSGAAGRLTKMRDESGDTEYTYDGFGRPVSKSQLVSIGGIARRFNTQFNYGTSGASTGHISSITYPSGNRVDFSYGQDGRISALTLLRSGETNQVTLLSDVSYSPSGNVTGWFWGGNTDASARYSRVFDLQGRILSYPLGHLEENGVVRTLIYDAVGRITGAVHSGNERAYLLDQAYSYDGLDRLIEFTTPATAQRFSYDKNGNRTSAVFGANSYTNTISPNSNRLSSTTGPTPAKTNSYDAAGNLLSDGTLQYVFGTDGRIASVSSGTGVTNYRYNGFGQRVAKIRSSGQTTYYVYDEQGQLLGEYDRNGAVLQETVYLGTMPVAVIKPSLSGGLEIPTESRAGLRVKNPAYLRLELGPIGPTPIDDFGIYHVFADHLGAPRVITQANDKKIVWRWDSTDPFGLGQPEESRTWSGKFSYNLRFPGQVFDAESNTHYNYFRDYDPQTGRYIQSDPIGLAAGVNTYTYVGGNPISGIDTLGLADLNLFNPNPGSHDYRSGAYAGGNVWNIRGFYTVAGHGNPGNMEDDRNGIRVLFPEDLARLIKDDPNWKGQPIVLGSCNVGNAWPDGHAGKEHWVSFSQSLADKLHVPVTGANGFARYNAKTGLLGATPQSDSPIIPGNFGRWTTFYPSR